MRIDFIFGGLSLAAFLCGPAAMAQPPAATEWQNLGMIGITAGQTARLNVLNPGLPAPAGTAAICSANLSFLDDQGKDLKDMAVSVIPGKSVSLDLNADKDLSPALGAGARLEIRALVSTPASGSYCLVPTLEIIDNLTGKTTVALSTPHLTPPPAAGRMPYAQPR